MKKYKIRNNWVKPEIEEIEVVRETKEFVILPQNEFWRRERRDKKISEYTWYFDTWEEAHEALKNKAIEHIKRLERQIIDAKDVLAAIYKLNKVG